ncbi:MAG: EAL domain-containing protein [Bdellovibrionota bacterium]
MVNYRSFEAGTQIFSAGQPGDCAYIVEAGQVEIFKISGEGCENHIAYLCPGELFGEMAIIDGGARAASARAKTACRLSVVTQHQLRKRMERADPIVRMLVKVLIERNRKNLGSIAFPTRALTIATQAEHSEAIDRIRMERELRAAIENGELLLQYQPIVDLKDGAISGFEALLRWNHPTKGMVSPGIFVPIAEETDLVEPIGRWVLQQALSDLPALESAYRTMHDSQKPLFMSVNVSGRQMEDASFFQALETGLEVTGVSPSSVKLEITESALTDPGIAREWIRRVKAIGARVSLDDFGTGYSSLGHMGQFDIDCLKLDKSLVDGLFTDMKSPIIARSVVAMATSLKLEIIVEGVETERQLKFLRQLPPVLVQGFYFARPMPFEQLIDHLVAWKKAA